jgi:Tfp pilus assembly protein PilN
MSQVNLLPPEVRQKSAARSQAIIVGIVGAALLGVVVVLYLLAGVSLNQTNSDLAAQIAVNAGLQGQVDDLLPYQDLADQLAAEQQTVNAAMANEVSWSGVLRDVQLTMPDQMALTSFSGTLDVAAAAAESPPPVIGTLSMAQETQGSLRTARWISRTLQVKTWADPWVSSLVKGDGDRWTSSTTIDLLPTAATVRGQAYLGGTG